MASIVTLAFLHHAAAFLVFAVLTVELVLMRGELTAGTAKTLLRMDALYGIGAAALLVVGLLRVFYTEKGAGYYFHSGTFIAKLSLFVFVALLSIYPTVKFMPWRKALKANQPPALDVTARRKIRMILHLELILLVAIILLAIMMARGVGFIG